MKQKKYQVKYRVTAIVGVDVLAKDMTDARAKVDKSMQKNIFANGIECMDERQEFVGVDDLELWDVTK